MSTTKKILVIVDMQNDFITGPLGNAECQAVLPKIVNLVSNNNFDEIILTRDTHQENYMDTQEGKHLPVPHCIEDSEGWQIVNEIANATANAEPIIIDKPSFGSIQLGQVLEGICNDYHGDIEITFTGVCTGICVISNVMIAKATLPEIPITVIADCCACVSPESHQTALDAMQLCQVAIQ